jgi:hypothetical protein
MSSGDIASPVNRIIRTFFPVNTLLRSSLSLSFFRSLSLRFLRFLSLSRSLSPFRSLSFRLDFCLLLDRSVLREGECERDSRRLRLEGRLESSDAEEESDDESSKEDRDRERWRWDLDLEVYDGVSEARHTERVVVGCTTLGLGLLPRLRLS